MPKGRSDRVGRLEAHSGGVNGLMVTGVAERCDLGRLPVAAGAAMIADKQRGEAAQLPGVETFELVRDGGLDQALVEIACKLGREPEPAGGGDGIGDHRPLACFVADLASVLLDARRSLHEPHAPGEQRHDFLIERVHAGSHVDHGLALFGLKHFALIAAWSLACNGPAG